jgi:NADH-quinone oxidoreductase subunit E
MLSPEERKEIEEECAMYEHRRPATPEALKVVQRHRGWVNDEAIKDVAEMLGASPEEVESVATFYNLIFRRPVGRHVILICDSVSCYIMGYETMKEHLSRKLGVDLGETTSDGRFTLLPNACLGVCEDAPAMMVDEDVHGNLTVEKIDEILQKYA